MSSFAPFRRMRCGQSCCGYFLRKHFTLVVMFRCDGPTDRIWACITVFRVFYGVFCGQHLAECSKRLAVLATGNPILHGFLPFLFCWVYIHVRHVMQKKLYALSVQWAGYELKCAIFAATSDQIDLRSTLSPHFQNLNMQNLMFIVFRAPAEKSPQSVKVTWGAEQHYCVCLSRRILVKTCM